MVLLRGRQQSGMGLGGWFRIGEIKEESSEVGAEILDRVECGF